MAKIEPSIQIRMWKGACVFGQEQYKNIDIFSNHLESFL